MTGGPVVLCILDGWGYREDKAGNAPALAATPNYDELMASQAPAMLACAGPDVGLPEGQMGNSEVGHMNIGAGRTVWMDLPKIDNAIADGSFAENAELVAFAKTIEADRRRCASDGVDEPWWRARPPTPYCCSGQGVGGARRAGRSASFLGWSRHGAIQRSGFPG